MFQLLGWLCGKKSTCQCRRHGFDPWARKIPWRSKWQLIPVSLPGKAHGQRSLAGCSPWGCKRVGHDLATKQWQEFHLLPHAVDFTSYWHFALCSWPAWWTTNTHYPLSPSNFNTWVVDSMETSFLCGCMWLTKKCLRSIIFFDTCTNFRPLVGSGDSDLTPGSRRWIPAGLSQL